MVIIVKCSIQGLISLKFLVSWNDLELLQTLALCL